jgi:chaperonin GroEL
MRCPVVSQSSTFQPCLPVQEPLATLVVNKLRGNLKVIAVKAPGFGERKTSYLEDIAIMTGATLVKDELGVTLEKATEEVFGTAAKVTVGKESCTIVAGPAHEAAIAARVTQIKNLISQTEQDYEKEKLNERVARLSGGVAVIQVCPQSASWCCCLYACSGKSVRHSPAMPVLLYQPSLA